jgi:hypothetical protein
MRIFIFIAIVFALAFTANGLPPEKAPSRPTAILVSPIHDAQIVRGSEGMDHVEYDLLVGHGFLRTPDGYMAAKCVNFVIDLRLRVPRCHLTSMCADYWAFPVASLDRR